MDVELVGVDCAEPPCTAIFRHAEHEFWNKLINACPGWVDRYGSSVGSSSGTVECGDGRSESVWRISPGGWVAPEPEGAPEQNAVLRMQARWDDIGGHGRLGDPFPRARVRAGRITESRRR